MQGGEAEGGDMTNAREGAWCILRTSGGKTLALAASLVEAGFEAWTPTARTWIAPTKRKAATERAAPIVPTFVFVRAHQMDNLWRARSMSVSRLPNFHILQLGGRVPEIGDTSLAGLRDEEARSLRIYQAQFDARVAGEARARRIDQLRTEQARRKALRTEVKTLALGEPVEIPGAPAFAGMVGKIVSGNGRSYVVGFGGSVEWTIEAWQLAPVAVCSSSTHAA